MQLDFVCLMDPAVEELAGTAVAAVEEQGQKVLAWHSSVDNSNLAKVLGRGKTVAVCNNPELAVGKDLVETAEHELHVQGFVIEECQRNGLGRRDGESVRRRRRSHCYGPAKELAGEMVVAAVEAVDTTALLLGILYQK